MLTYYKNSGETPLEMLNRLREERTELKNEKLSYIGRLDPLAEGEIIVLVGEENKEYEKHLDSEKTYIATFMFGLSTDTGDILGKEIWSENIKLDDYKIKKENLKNTFKEYFPKINKQIYPWFSAKTINGVKMFDIYKNKEKEELEKIKRPEREVSIINSDLIKFYKVEINKLEDEIVNKISKVNGDFRQKEAISDWEEYFNKLREDNIKEVLLFDLEAKVSSGTYIRGLTEIFCYPVTLFNLKRTKIHSSF